MKNGLLIILLALAACSPKPAGPQPPRNAAELLQGDTFWSLAFGDTFGDGGSITLSFIGGDGQIIHVWAQARRDPAAAPQRFYLQRTYNDPDAVEILPGSPLEARVIELLTTHKHRDDYTLPKSYPRHFIAMLRDRKRPFPKDDEWQTDPK